MFCGCIKDIFCPEFSIQDSIIQLNNVLELLTELDNKYEKEIDIKRTEIKNLCKKNNNKNTKKLFLIKTIKLIEYQRHSIQKRMIACQSKQYQLESLNIAKIQINALKTSSHTFKKFMKDNDINKIEKLQDDFSDLIEQVIEINDIIKDNPSAVDLNLDDIDIDYELKRLTHEDYHLLPTVPTNSLVSKEIELTEHVDSSSPLLVRAV